jgi:hypothetical protein
MRDQRDDQSSQRLTVARSWPASAQEPATGLDCVLDRGMLRS